MAREARSVKRPRHHPKILWRSVRNAMKLRPPNIMVLGLFPDRIQAESAIEALVSATFPESKLSILIPDKPTTTDFDFERNSKAPEGAVTGGVVGGTLGILWGAGVFAIPGVGPFLAAGPITAMLAGLGAGTTTGAVIGALVGIGIPEFEAKRYPDCSSALCSSPPSAFPEESPAMR